MFGKIMVALDTHETCALLFNQALALAQETNAALTLLSVLSSDDGTLPLLSYPGVIGYPLTVNETIWEVQQRQYKEHKAQEFSLLSHFVDRATAAGIQAEFVQATGDPGRVICDCARTKKVDLVMVGSHRRRGLNELLTGSISSYVMHRAPCSVLVVHEKNAGKAAVESADKTAA